MESAKEKFGPRNFYKKLQFLFNSSLRSQKTYIIPTRLGLSYSALCFILLLMAMAYGNNLVFIICFSLTCMGMLLAKSINTTIEQVKIVSSDIKIAFAEPHQILHILITNTANEPLEDLYVSIKEKKSLKVKTRLNPLESIVVEYPWDIVNRGYIQIPTVVVSSEYPSRLFRAWKILKSDTKALVYPARRGSSVFPNYQAQSQNSVGVIREIRDYRPGDSPKRIHWRSLAKNKQLRTLVHETDSDKKCQLEWKDLSHLDLEAKLSQMSLWIDQAENKELDWTLILPDQIIERMHRPEAYQQAMTILALWRAQI